MSKGNTLPASRAFSGGCASQGRKMFNDFTLEFNYPLCWSYITVVTNFFDEGEIPMYTMRFSSYVSEEFSDYWLPHVKLCSHCAIFGNDFVHFREQQVEVLLSWSEKSPVSLSPCLPWILESSCSQTGFVEVSLGVPQLECWTGREKLLMGDQRWRKEKNKKSKVTLFSAASALPLSPAHMCAPCTISTCRDI